MYIAFKQGIDIETQVIEDIFNGKELPNLTAEEVINYMKDRANDSLIKLGLKPILFDDVEIEKIYKVAQRHKNKINLETLDPKNRIKWNLG